MQFHPDKSNLPLSLIISTLLHIAVITFAPVVKPKKIIYISFPIELITLPSLPEIEEETKAIAVPEIVTKKKTKVKKLEKPKEQPAAPAKQSQIAKQPVSSLSVEAAKFPFMYYLNQIRKKIAENWVYSAQTGNLRTVVYFRIKSDGSIEGPKLNEHSDDKIFNQMCLRAIKLAEPFPPLPAGYEEEYLGVYFEFAFRE